MQCRKSGVPEICGNIVKMFPCVTGVHEVPGAITITPKKYKQGIDQQRHRGLCSQREGCTYCGVVVLHLRGVVRSIRKVAGVPVCGFDVCPSLLGAPAAHCFDLSGSVDVHLWLPIPPAVSWLWLGVGEHHH